MFGHVHTYLDIFQSATFSMHIYKKIRVRKYPNRIVLVRPHLPDMYPDKSTLFSTEHAHYQET